MLLRIFSALILLLVFSPPIDAQELNPTFNRLNEMNRIQPLQNPEYERTDRILGRRILDRKNKVVGQVHDVLLTRYGNISSLAVDFDRLRLREEVYLSYSDTQIRPASNGYVLGFDSAQIKALYPELLANIETAAGNSDIFSVHKIVGADVKAQDGRTLGIVDQVLFGGNGSRAEALYVSLNGMSRGKGVAIPFGSARMAYKEGQVSIMVSDDIADSMMTVANKD